MEHPAFHLIKQQLLELPEFISKLQLASMGEEGLVLTCLLAAPDDSPYSLGSPYPLHIRFPHDYPRSPPLVRFACIFDHHNISPVGTFSPPDILEQSWTPSSTLADALFALYNLIDNPIFHQIPDVDTVKQLWEHHANEECECFFSSCFPMAPVQYLGLTPPLREAADKQFLENIRVGYEVLQDKTAQAMFTRCSIARDWLRMTSFPELYDDQVRWQESWFAPSFYEAIRDGSEAAIRAIVHQDAPGIFSFDMFSATFCDALLQEVKEFEESPLPKSRPNSMNNYGLILNNIGLERKIDQLLQLYIQPVARIILKEATEGHRLDHHHSFIVEYKEGHDLSLDMHTDDSDVTLNINICDAFTGSGLSFCGLYGGVDRRQLNHVYQHVKGRAVMHSGLHTHGADELATGERYNMIIWCRSSSYRLSDSFQHRYARPLLTEYEPDQRCLSKTHDRDYSKWMKHFANEHSS